LIINLKEVNKENWFEVTKLQISEENGKRFVVPVVYSLAESKFQTHMLPLAIYADETLVGFTMYGKDPEDNNYWIYVFMIDKRHQSKGLGKASLQRLINYICNKHRVNRIVISHKPDNLKAARLYETVGFINTGQIIWEEIVKEYCES
jgi:diamine N-acetyltransferase